MYAVRVAVQSVREATFDVWREYGLTSIFANPGSTEIQLLADLPDDFRFVLALHESSVVGMATGWAIGRGEPALAILHTTAGLGNAVGALATARVNRAPLVVLVGQQDRRHLATEPFLAGKLQGLAGEYPVWVDQPVRPQDVPGAIARALHEAVTGRGPGARDRADGRLGGRGSCGRTSAPRRAASCVRGRPTARPSRELAALFAGAASPALVVGAGADDPDTWEALVALAERLGCPVWQESFSAPRRVPAGSPAVRRPSAGRPRPPARDARAARPRARRRRAGVPAVPVRPGPVRRARDDRRDGQPAIAAEVHRSTAELAVLARPGRCAPSSRASFPRARTRRRRLRRSRPRRRLRRPGEPLRAGHVFAAIAERIPRDAIVIEESPRAGPS